MVGGVDGLVELFNLGLEGVCLFIFEFCLVCVILVVW